MFHTGRCGSTVLGSMLSGHSKVYWAREIFRPHMQTTSLGIPGIAAGTIKKSISDCNADVYGFETKYLSFHHLSRKAIGMDIQQYIRLLLELNFSHFVILQRRNYLRRAISDKLQKLWVTGISDRLTIVHKGSS